MDLRIGVSRSSRELTIELADSDRDAVRQQIDDALNGTTTVLWLTDKRGRSFAVQAANILYVELGLEEGGRRIGFGG
ncbi:MAG: DUF3107 domain-containing protein [Ilumatobacteraceae bacterium]